MTHRTRTVASFLLPLFLIASAASAQLPSAKLTCIFPPGGKAGTTVEVKATGTDLDGATDILFAHPGIKAKAAEGGVTTEAKFTVTISPDVPVGAYDARVVGRFGASNPRLFVVGDRPEMEPQRPGSSAQDAKPVPIGSLVNGRCSAASADFYTVECKKGQRVLIICETREIDSRMSPVMVLQTKDGRELERSRRGGLIDFRAPEDGAFVLDVHDLLFRGGPEYFYRLTVGAGPRIDAIFPPVGEPGSKGKYTLYGRNLPGSSQSDIRGADGKPLEQLQVDIELPSDPLSQQKLQNGSLVSTAGASLDGVEYRVKSDSGASNPVLITMSKAPVTQEKESNDTPDQAQPIKTPCEFAGQFYPRGDADWLSFEANKGDTLWIEIISDRVGAPSSPFVLIQKVGPDGKASDLQELASSDVNVGGAFKTSSRDSAYKFEPKESGTFRMMVRDLFNTSADNPGLVYRLSIRKAAPDFRFVVIPSAEAATGRNNDNNRAGQDPSVPFLRKGGATPLKIVLFRQDGFDGAVTLEADGMPQGVTCTSSTIPAGESVGAMVLTASDDVKTWSGPIKVTGKSKSGDEELVREGRFGAVVWGPTQMGGQPGEPASARLTRDLALAVSGDEAEAVSIRAEGGPFEVKSGEPIKIPLKLTRRAEIKPPLKLKPVGPAAMKDVKEISIEGNGDSASLELDLSKQKLAPGAYTFYLQGSASVKYERPGGEPAKDDKAKAADKGKNAGKGAKDVTATFYSAPITLNVLPGEKKK